MNNSLGTIIEAIGNNIISIIGVILAFIFAYFLFIIKEKRAIPKLGYERISSLSLVSMDKRISSRIKVICDGKPTNSIFSFRFRIRNMGKVPIKRIPIVVEFNDENVQILDIKENFEYKDRVKKIELFLENTKKDQGKFIITPGLEKSEEGTFDVFTKGNTTADLSSLVIKLGEKTLGIQWRYLEKKEISPLWFMLVIMLIGTGILFVFGLENSTETTPGKTAATFVMAVLLVGMGFAIATLFSRKYV